MSSLNNFHELDAFMVHLKTEQGASVHTIEAYNRDILSYLIFLEEEAKTTLETVDFEDYLVHLRIKGKKTRSIARAVSAIRSFYKFLLIDGKIKTNPIVEIEIPRFKAPVPRALSEEEMVKLLKLPADQKLALRDAAVLELLYAAGLRVSELCSLKKQDVNLEAGFLVASGKRSKNGSCPSAPTHGRSSNSIWSSRSRRGPIFFRAGRVRP